MPKSHLQEFTFPKLAVVASLKVRGLSLQMGLLSLIPGKNPGKTFSGEMVESEQEPPLFTTSLRL